jgi:hypothetical protein
MAHQTHAPSCQAVTTAVSLSFSYARHQFVYHYHLFVSSHCGSRMLPRVPNALKEVAMTLMVKRSFPSVKNRTLGEDLMTLVSAFFLKKNSSLNTQGKTLYFF